MEVLIYLGKAAAILSIFYFVHVAVLRRDTLFSINRHFLLTGIIAAITFPFIVITKTVQVTISGSSELSDKELLPIEQIPIQEAVDIQWWQAAFFIYILGVSFMFLRFFKQLGSLVLLLYKYPSVKRHGYRYISTSENTPPFSFFKNIVYNPTLHTQQELEMIFKHEEVHASQWHSFDIIATHLLLIFQWANPLAWLYKKRIEENLEYIADSATVRQIESVKQYQLALVRASSTSPIPALSTKFYQSFIKKRIVMLNKRTSKKINAVKLTFVLPLLAVFLWSFNINEVVRYTDQNKPESEITTPSSALTKTVLPSENKKFNDPEKNSGKTKKEIIPEHEENHAIEEAVAKEKKIVSGFEISVQDGMATITKNTTKSELDAIKTNLKSKGIGFDYSNLMYNNSSEIIGISITYRSSNGNSGKYRVKSDTPISTIVIKADADSISVQSAGSSSYSHSNNNQHAKTDKQRAMIEKRHVEMEARRQKMEESKLEMKERQKEMEVYRIERQNEMEERRAEMHERQGNTFYSSNIERITKNSSKNDLEKLKTAFESKGISFSYNGVKRNVVGEITKIKLKIKDNKGSSSASSYDGEGQSIDDILIDINNGITIIKGRSH